MTDAPAERRPAHVYLAHVRVRHHQLDPLGHVTNAAYLNFLEQAAIDHAAAAGFDAERLRAWGAQFIARRHEIDVLRPALAGDRPQVRTWADDVRGARAVRTYTVYRLPRVPLGAPPAAGVPEPTGELVVRAGTEWAYVDIATGRPRRILPSKVDAFFNG